MKGLENRRVRRSWLLGAVLCGVLVGLGTAHYGFEHRADYVWLALALSPILLLKRPISLLIALVIGMSFGLWRGDTVMTDLSVYDVHVYQKVTVIGRIADDPAYSDDGQLEYYLDSVVLNGDRVPGKIRVKGFSGSAAFRRSDTVRVTGKLYPGFGGRQGSVSYSQMELVQRSNSWLEQFRRSFFAGVYNALTEPQASLGLGFLVGTRSLLPEDLTLQLRIVGLSHIVAVSGYNLTILVRFARRLGSRFSKRLALILAFALVGGFLLVAGASPSITRAAVVTALALTAWFYGRVVSPIMLLIASSALTAFVNPLFLWGDLGWWLSFLAFFGILIIAPLVKARFFHERKLSTIANIVLETTSAQITTVPLIMFVFGELSVISLLANVIVLPIIPLAMLTGFVSGLVGMIMPAIAGWFTWPAQLILTFITEVVGILSLPSWAFIEQHMSIYAATAVYATVLAVCFAMFWGIRKTKRPVFAESVIE